MALGLVEKAMAWTNGQPRLLVLLLLGAFMVFFPLLYELSPGQPRVPSFGSLERLEAVVEQVDRQPLRIDNSPSTSRYASRTVRQSGGGWNLLLDLGNEEKRWFEILRPSGPWAGTLMEVLGRLPAKTPVVVWHEGARIWQLELPEGIVLDYRALVAEAEKARTKRHTIQAGFVVLGLILIVASLVAIRRGRPARPPAGAAEGGSAELAPPERLRLP